MDTNKSELSSTKPEKTISSFIESYCIEFVVKVLTSAFTGIII